MAARHLWQDPAFIAHTRMLLDCHQQALGRPLVAGSGDDVRDAQLLYGAAFAVVSHGVEADPILNYGNAAALALWETDWPAFTQLPSRLTAEPVALEERAAMLEQARRAGYIDNYSGIRISVTGRRFSIHHATIWNLFNRQGQPAGQAATFREWHFLDS